jgi:nicotinic acid mononucleotide adenylyltransferase
MTLEASVDRFSPVESYEPWDFARLDQAAMRLVTDAHPRGPLIVLLTTGAMNPVHRGHVGMLHAAARGIHEQNRGTVLGAFISPSHDNYLRGKFGETGYLPARQRLAYCNAALQDQNLVSLGAWEAQRSGDWPDFPEVCSALDAALQKRYDHIKLSLWYCCGEDHYRKCSLYRGVGKSFGVCVIAREGKLPDTSRADPAKVIVVASQDDPDAANHSSTKVREALTLLRRMVDPAVLRLMVDAPTAAA